MAPSYLAGPLGCSSLWNFHNNFRKQEIFSPWFISLVSSLSVTAINLSSKGKFTCIYHFSEFIK